MPASPPSPTPVDLAAVPADDWWESTWPERDDDPLVRQARDLAAIMSVFEQRRLIMGLSRYRLAEVAAAAGLGATTVAALWAGKSWPTFKTLHRVGEVLGVTIEGRGGARPPVVTLARTMAVPEYVDAVHRATPEVRRAVYILLGLPTEPES